MTGVPSDEPKLPLYLLPCLSEEESPASEPDPPPERPECAERRWRE
jgi:hypothetical protein